MAYFTHAPPGKPRIVPTTAHNVITAYAVYASAVSFSLLFLDTVMSIFCLFTLRHVAVCCSRLPALPPCR